MATITYDQVCGSRSRRSALSHICNSAAKILSEWHAVGGSSVEIVFHSTRRAPRTVHGAEKTFRASQQTPMVKRKRISACNQSHRHIATYRHACARSRQVYTSHSPTPFTIRCLCANKCLQATSARVVPWPTSLPAVKCLLEPVSHNWLHIYPTGVFLTKQTKVLCFSDVANEYIMGY